MHAFYLQRTIHLAETEEADALCGRRLIGAIDTEAAATCPACLRRAREIEESDAYDAERDAEAARYAAEQQEAGDEMLHPTLAEAEAARDQQLASLDALDELAAQIAAARPEADGSVILAAPQPARRAAYPASVGGGAKIHAALLPTPPQGLGADLGAATIACGAGRRSFTSVGYAFAPTIRSRPGQAIDCASCLRSIEAHSTPLGEEAGPPCSHCGGPTLAPSRPGEEGNYCPACGTAWTDTVAAQPEPAEADLPPAPQEARELIGIEARYLRPGDIIVAAGCQHRDWRGCDHRLYAAFDLLLQDGEQGERMTIWTAIADQEAGQPPRLTLPAGQRLLVQRRLPDWKIAEAPSFAAAIIDLAMPELPQLCGPAGNLTRGGDLNSTWTCARAHGLWGMHRRQAELAEELDRLPRLRSPRRRAALADWIARAFVRYEALNRSYLGRLPACAHPEGMRQEMSVEEALPPCTC